MIAKVRIAPVEQWCEGLRDNAKSLPELQQLCGMPIEIEPDSMKVESRMHEEDCRWWRISPKTKEDLIEKVPRLADHPSRYVCEHMLEMD